jgi:hypothetical protein
MASLETVAAPAPSFIIRVLEGPLSSQPLQAGKDPGVIELAGRSLPARGLAFEGRQRIKTRFYAGNTVATQQVTGPVLEPTTMNGVWHDKHLGNGMALALCLLFNRIMRTASPLEISWSGIIRRGLLKTWKFTPERVEDIAWEGLFEWSSEGEQPAPLITSTGVANPREGLRAVFDAATDAVNVLQSYQTDPISRVVNFPQRVLAAMDDATATIFDRLEQLELAVNVATTVANLPREVLERGISLSKSIATTLQDVEDALLDPFLDLEDPGTSGTWVGLKALAYAVKDDSVGLLDHWTQKYALLHAAQVGRETCINTASELEGQLYPDAIAEERPPAGSDLRDLAKKYYGDGDLWFMIAQYNGLTSSAVPPLPDGPSDNPARTIKIPRRQQGELADLRKAC